MENYKMAIQVEFEFILPKGLLDKNGNIHRKGIMRLATAADEILPLKDPRIQQNPAYLTVVVLSRVITKIENVPTISTKTIESLFASDLAYLQTFYNKINGEGNTKTKIICPNCKKEFEVEIGSPGE
jgi:hypothetical protein